MTPIVHGRIYPETKSSELVGYALRVLIDPRTARSHEREMLNIDTLRIYLRRIASPCQIELLLPAQRTDPELEATYEFMRGICVKELPSAAVAAPEAAIVFPDAPRDSDLLGLASTAWFADTDILASEDVASRPEAAAGFRKLHIQLVGAQEAQRACEIFVRGHDVPWSFGFPAWLMPWTTFYPMIDPDIQAMEDFRGLAARKGVSVDVRERIRSLGLNRWSAIAHTRDKLLFYTIQRRRAKRRKLERQDFSFELSYFLTAYFLLFWGALDQFSWIVNEICGLGFTAKDWWKVGVGKKQFVNRLRGRDPAMMAIFEEPEFLRWIDVLRRARHYVAHQGTAMLSPLFEKPTPEPSLADIDRDIEGWPEWRVVPAALAENFRATFRTKWRMRNLRLISDAAFVLQDATTSVITFPLEDIDWEYQRFREFALAVVARCSANIRVTL